MIKWLVKVVSIYKDMKFDPKAFGIASGLLWGGAMFIVSVIAVINGYASDFLQSMASVYPGYHFGNFGGAVIGGIYGFLDGLIGGWLFAWLYNRFLKG